MDHAITIKQNLQSRKFMVLGVILGVGFWFIDALVDTLFLSNQAFSSELVKPTAECLFNRISVLVISLFSGGYFQYVFGRMKDAESALGRVNAALEKRVDERTVELNAASGYLLSEYRERKSAEFAARESHAQLSTLLQAIPDAVYFKDRDFRYRVFNRATEEILGRTKDEILGMTDESLMASELFEHCRKSDEQTLREGRLLVREEQFTNSTGEKVFMESTKIPIFDEKGNATGLVGVSRDITAQKRMEEILKEEKEKIEAILNNIPDIAWLKDRQSRFVAVNEPFGRACGMDPEDLVGKTDMDIWPEDLARRYREDDADVIRSGKRKVVEEPLADREGRVAWLETIKTPIYNSQGVIIGTTGIARDITERKRIEQERQDQKKRLEEMVKDRTFELARMYDSLQREMEERLIMEARMKEQHGMKVVGELAAGVAHEVRNPLHAILSITEALKQELKDTPDVDVFLSHIREQVKRLSHLMQDLLELGKPVERENFSEESIDNICSSVASLCRSNPGIKDHPIVVVSQASVSCRVRGDCQRLQQVFINLVENAAQHSPAGSEIRIVIDRPYEETIRVSVVDRGAGIPEEILSRIYDPFFSTRKKGVGLGLSIVRNIVELHGGSLEIKNNTPREGCTATVFLPRHRGNGS